MGSLKSPGSICKKKCANHQSEAPSQRSLEGRHETLYSKVPAKSRIGRASWGSWMEGSVVSVPFFFGIKWRRPSWHGKVGTPVKESLWTIRWIIHGAHGDAVLGCQRSALAFRGPPFWKKLKPKNVDVLWQGIAAAPVVKPAIFPVHTGNPWKTCNGQYMHGIAADMLSNKPVTLYNYYCSANTPITRKSRDANLVNS